MCQLERAVTRCRFERDRRLVSDRVLAFDSRRIEQDGDSIVLRAGPVCETDETTRERRVAGHWPATGPVVIEALSGVGVRPVAVSAYSTRSGIVG